MCSQPYFQILRALYNLDLWFVSFNFDARFFQIICKTLKGSRYHISRFFEFPPLGIMPHAPYIGYVLQLFAAGLWSMRKCRGSRWMKQIITPWIQKKRGWALRTVDNLRERVEPGYAFWRRKRPWGGFAYRRLFRQSMEWANGGVTMCFVFRK